MFQKLLLLPPVQFALDGARLYFSRRISLAAAGLTYFLILTAFPMLICVSYLLGLANIDLTALLLEVEVFLPEAALDIMEGFLFYISYQQSPALFWAGLAGCWLSAAAAYRIIAQVIRDVYEVVNHSPLRNMIASVIFPLGLLVTLALSVVVVTTGQHTLETISAHLPFLSQYLRLWVWLRYVLLFAVFFLALVVLLTMASPRGTPRRPTMVTSLVAAVALVVSSGVFSVFIGMSTRYSLVYGSLVSLIILLVWMYLCGQILFLAIVFTSVWYKNRQPE